MLACTTASATVRHALCRDSSKRAGCRSCFDVALLYHGQFHDYLRVSRSCFAVAPCSLSLNAPTQCISGDVSPRPPSLSPRHQLLHNRLVSRHVRLVHRRQVRMCGLFRLLKLVQSLDDDLQQLLGTTQERRVVYEHQLSWDASPRSAYRCSPEPLGPPAPRLLAPD